MHIHQFVDPPDLVKTVGRPKTKRTREKDASTKRAGEWAHSRKGTRMTCSKCGSQAHNAGTCKTVEEEQRKRGRPEEVEQYEEVFDFNSSAPQPIQEEDYHFMPTPRLRKR